MDNLSKEELEDFETVYNQFYIPVYRFFVKHLNAKEISEDLTADVFYSCFKNYSKYDPSKATISTWIYSIARNKLKNYYRDKKNILSIDDEDRFIDLPDGADMEGAVFLSQMSESINNALEFMTERERKSIQLKYFSDLNSEEIAAELGITAGNVRVIISRSLKKLAKYFEEKGIRWDY